MCDILNTYNPLLEGEALDKAYAQYGLSYSLERMLKNINLINAGVNAKTINVTNTTLFAVAATEYGDADYWNYLADVNGLDDFLIEGSATLIIPPKPSATLQFGNND